MWLLLVLGSRDVLDCAAAGERERKAYLARAIIGFFALLAVTKSRGCGNSNLRCFVAFISLLFLSYLSTVNRDDVSTELGGRHEKGAKGQEVAKRVGAGRG